MGNVSMFESTDACRTNQIPSEARSPSRRGEAKNFLHGWPIFSVTISQEIFAKSPGAPWPGSFYCRKLQYPKVAPGASLKRDFDLGQTFLDMSKLPSAVVM